MELMTMLHARKAVREYTGQVTPDQLQQLLHAASAAPVGRGNYDNYRLTVIQKPEILQQLPGIYDAPTVIVVSAREVRTSKYLSAGAIIHNIELAAEDMGLGANHNLYCVASLPPAIIPAGFTPLFAITLGQTTTSFTPRPIPVDRIKANIVK